MKIGPVWWRMVSQYFQNPFWIYKTLRTPPWASKLNFEISHPSKSLLSVHNSFFGPQISNPIPQKLFVYNLYEPLWFSVKIRSYEVNRYPNDENGVTLIFEISLKMN